MAVFDATLDIANKSPGALGAVERRFGIGVPIDFQDDGPAKTQFGKLPDDGLPKNLPITRGKMIVSITTVVAGVKHPQVPGQLVDNRWQVTGKMSVPGVQTDSHVSTFNGT